MTHKAQKAMEAAREICDYVDYTFTAGADLCNGDIDHDMEPDADGAFVLFKDLAPSVPVSELEAWLSRYVNLMRPSVWRSFNKLIAKAKQPEGKE